MRPTIPLGPWRLAVDLAATRAIDALDAPGAAPPARGCDCDDCVLWARAHEEVLPPALLVELRRVGMDPARPSDVYRLTREGMRVTWHCVGRILGGPRRDTAESGRHYETLRPAPEVVAMAVDYADGLAPRPEWATAEMEPLILVDLYVSLDVST